MILVKDLKNTLKEGVILMINLGYDENNISHITPYDRKYDTKTIEEIYSIAENSIGVTLL